MRMETHQGRFEFTQQPFGEAEWLKNFNSAGRSVIENAQEWVRLLSKKDLKTETRNLYYKNIVIHAIPDLLKLKSLPHLKESTVDELKSLIEELEDAVPEGYESKQ